MAKSEDILINPNKGK